MDVKETVTCISSKMLWKRIHSVAQKWIYRLHSSAWTLGFTKLIVTRRRRGLVAQSLTLNRRVAIIRWKTHKSITSGEWVFFRERRRVTLETEAVSMSHERVVSKAFVRENPVVKQRSHLTRCYWCPLASRYCSNRLHFVAAHHAQAWKETIWFQEDLLLLAAFVPIDVLLNKNLDTIEHWATFESLGYIT